MARKRRNKHTKSKAQRKRMWAEGTSETKKHANKWDFKLENSMPGPVIVTVPSNAEPSGKGINSFGPIMTPGHDTQEHLAKINIQPFKEGELPWG